MDVYRKSLYTHSFDGSIHVDDLLYLYEKIWFVSFLHFPAFKKIEPGFEVRLENGENRNLTLQDVKSTFSPEETLSGCKFTLRLPPLDNHEQNVSSIIFSSDNRQCILITVEGTDQNQVTATAETIIYKINPYVASMNKTRQPPTQHEDRKTYSAATENAKQTKPYLGMNVYEAPAVQANLSDKAKEQIEKDSRKNSKYVWIVFLAVLLLVLVVLIIAKMSGHLPG